LLILIKNWTLQIGKEGCFSFTSYELSQGDQISKRTKNVVSLWRQRWALFVNDKSRWAEQCLTLYVFLDLIKTKYVVEYDDDHDDDDDDDDDNGKITQ